MHRVTLGTPRFSREFSLGVVAAQPDPRITVQLRGGAGYDGAVLATETVATIPDSTAHDAWVDFAFDAPPLLRSGKKSTLQFTQDTGCSVSGRHQSAGFDAYDGGMFFGAGGAADPDGDLAFRIGSALPFSVPEALAWAVGGLVAAASSVTALVRRRCGHVRPVF